jgi:RNA polymerase sigma-70 factor (ECF subfamily)
MNDVQPDNEQLRRWWLSSVNGDSSSFGYLHKELYPGLFCYACKLLGDDDLADDAVQELFIKIWNKRLSIGDLQNVKAYFFTALRRQTLNQLRDLKLRQLKISMVSQPDLEFTQEEILVRKEEGKQVTNKILQLLNTLPKRQKEVVYLYFFEEMSLTQISAVLEINYQSVMNLKQRALVKMRTITVTTILVFVSLFCTA